MNPFIFLQNTFDPKSFAINILSLLFLVQLAACNNENKSLDLNESTEQLSEKAGAQLPGIGPARDISSFDLVAEMGVGWNLGNSFDIESKDQTYWGNPITSKAMIDEVKAMGFSTLRIAITWSPNQVEMDPHTINPHYLTEIKRVVDFDFQNKMDFTIDVNHDNSWIKPMASKGQENADILSSLWTQVANSFQDYNDSLIFETLNEPRIEGITEEWSGENLRAVAK